MPSLPLVGVEAAILGMSAFKANATTVNSLLASMGRSGRLLQNIFSSDTSGNAVARNAAIIEKANLTVQRVVAQTALNNQRAQQSATVAAANAARAQQNVATVTEAAEQRIAKAKYASILAQDRLTTAINLANKAPTAARQAAAANAATSHTAAILRLNSAMDAYGTKTVEAHDKAAQAAAKSGAAQQTVSNVAAVGLERQRIAQLGLKNATVGTGAAAGVAGGLIVGAAVAGAAAIFALVHATSELIQTSAEYQDQQNAIAAIGNETYASIGQLSKAQLDLATNSNQSAAELQNFSAEMVMAGLDSQLVTEHALATGNAMIVASNGTLEAGRAATLLTVAYQGFGKAAVDVGRLKPEEQFKILEEASNAATAATQESSIRFNQFADAMRQGGGVAARMGLTIQEFSAAIGVMGKTIESGTEIGTGLRMMFQNLQAPSDDAAKVMEKYKISLYNADGQTRDFRDVLIGLENAFGTTAQATGKITEAQAAFAVATLFGARAQKTISALINQGVDSYDAMFEAVSSTTRTQDTANRIMGSTVNMMKEMGNTTNAAGLAFGEGFEPYVNSSTKSLKLLQEEITPTNDSMKSWGDTVGSIVFNALSGLGEIITFVVTTVKALSEVFLAFQQLLPDIINGVLGFTDTTSKSFGAWEAFVAQRLADASAWFEEFKANLVQGINNVGKALETGGRNFNLFGTGVANVWNAVVGVVGDAIEAVGKNLDSMGTAFNAFLTGLGGIPASFASAFGQLGTIVGKAFQAVVNKVNEFLNSLAGVPLVGEMIGGARASFSAFSTGVSAAGVAVQKFATTAVKAIKSIQLPNFRNYAAETAANIKAARDAIDRNIKPTGRGGLPATEREAPGSYPPGGGGDDAGKAAKKAAEDYAKNVNKAQELLRDFFDDIARMSSEAAEAWGEAFQKAGDDIAKAMQKADQDIAEATLHAEQEIADIHTDRLIKKDADARRDALDKEIDAAAKARDQMAEDTEVAYDRELEDLRTIEDKKRQEREKAFDRNQEREARDRDERRANEDREFDRSFDAYSRTLSKQQDLEQKALELTHGAREEALKKQLDSLENALEKEQKLREQALEKDQETRQRALETDQKAREKALDDRLKAEEDALERSQKQREDALQNALDAEKRQREYGIAASEITSTDVKSRGEAQAEFETAVARGVKRSIAQARLDEKLADIKAKTDAAREELKIRQDTNASELEFEAQQQAKIDALRATFEAENTAREAAAEAAKLALRAQIEAETFALREQMELETLALRAQIEQETLALRAETDRQTRALRVQLEKELDDLHAKHERERDDLSDRIERDRLNRQKDRARQDREFAEQQEAAKQKFIDIENKKQLEETRKAEDTARTRKRLLEGLAIVQRETDEKRRADLVEALDNEELYRKIVAIDAERDHRIETTKKTLAEEEDMIRKQLDKQLEDLNRNLDQKIDAVRRQYIDRLQDIIEDAGDAIIPITDNIGEQMNQAFGDVKKTVEGLIAALEAAIAKAAAAAAAIKAIPAPPAATPAPTPAPPPGGAPAKCDWFGIYNACRGNGGSESSCRSKADKDCPVERRAGGGPVSGGAAYIVGERGPELFVPSQNGRIIPNGWHKPGDCPSCPEGGGALSLVRMAESMMGRGGGAAGGVTTNTQYTVNANYGRTQPEGSILRDLSALVTLTSR